MEEDTKITEPVEQEEVETVEESADEPVEEKDSEEPQVETPEETPVEESVKNPELNCPDCNGEGLNAEQTARCVTCEGTGRV